MRKLSPSQLSLPRSLCLYVAWLLGGLGISTPMVIAQQKASPIEAVAHVRNWAVLGDLDSQKTYTLAFEPEKAKPGQERKTIFTKLKGCRRSGYGAGYFTVPPGRTRFVLTEDGEKPITVAEFNETFEKDAAYTVLALLENGTPALKLIKEYPTLPESDGVYIYNLLTDPALQLHISNVARSVPAFSGQPLFVPAAQFSSVDTEFSFLSKRGTMIRKEVSYTGGRLSVVFMRNDYSQPSTFIYPARPSSDQ